ncbi:hypothetical protein N9Y42_00255 [Mariniblastus sp.]|nr:hypothetical protein [Mariniblastus sp.]
MFLDSKFKAMRQPLCQSLCLLIGVLGFHTAFSLQPVHGQPIIQQPVIQQPVIQQPVIQQQPVFQQPQNQIYQSPPYRAPVYQNPTYYQNQGRIIQSQPVPAGPVYRSPTGNVQIVPPVAERIPQPIRPQQNQPNTRQTFDAEQEAYTAEKLVLLEKLLEKYKATAADNENALKQLGSLKQENAELVKRMGEFDQTTKRYQTQVATLQEKLSASGEPDAATLQEAERLKANYQGAVNQVRELETKVKSLSGENQNYLNQITSLKAAQENALNSRPDNSQLEMNQSKLVERNQQLVEDKQSLEQANQGLLEQNRELELKQRSAVTTIDELNGRIAKLNVDDDSSVDAGEVADVSKVAPIETETEVPASVEVPADESEVLLLTRKNRQLSESNADFKKQNRTLSRELATLKNQSGDPVEASSITAGSLPLAVSTADVDTTEGTRGWGVLAWLIPFLAIGLGIAFFVIIREELHRPPTASTNRSSINE